MEDNRTCGHKFILTNTCDECRRYVNEKREARAATPGQPGDGVIYKGDPAFGTMCCDPCSDGCCETAEKLEITLSRAAYVAEHLLGMIPREVWRAEGGDDGQGHYEGDYRAARLAEEIKGWKVLIGDA